MLASLKEVCQEMKKRGGAVGSFNTPDSESLWAVLRAAEELNVPVIIAHAQCHDYAAPLDRVAPMMISAAERSKIPVCVHLDHGEDAAYCIRAIRHGFTSVMIDRSVLPYEDNVAQTEEVVRFAHAAGVDVEAELGALPSREGQSASDVRIEDTYTDPALVPDFLARTGADALAIAFGTAHGIYKSKPVLNLDVIRRVRAWTDAPLVMHGGSGISNEDYRAVIACGINKINYYTYMSYDGYAAAKRLTETKSEGYFHDLSLASENAMYDKVLSVLKVFSGQ